MLAIILAFKSYSTHFLHNVLTTTHQKTQTLPAVEHHIYQIYLTLYTAKRSIGAMTQSLP